MTDVRLTQQPVEEWLSTNPDVRATIVLVEQWASVQSVSGQVVLTTMLVEQWASVEVPVVPSGDIRVMVLA